MGWVWDSFGSDLGLDGTYGVGRWEPELGCKCLAYAHASICSSFLRYFHYFHLFSFVVEHGMFPLSFGFLFMDMTAQNSHC